MAFLVVAFGLKAIEGMVSYYMTVDEFVEHEEKYLGKRLKLAGHVVTGSLQVDGQVHRFSIENQGAQMAVIYTGFPPDTFVEGVDVVVEGRTEDGDVFVAHTLMAKCASKYEVGDIPNSEWISE